MRSILTLFIGRAAFYYSGSQDQRGPRGVVWIEPRPAYDLKSGAPLFLGRSLLGVGLFSLLLSLLPWGSDRRTRPPCAGVRGTAP